MGTHSEGFLEHREICYLAIYYLRIRRHKFPSNPYLCIVMDATNRTYIAIDLKSFFASVECAERGLDPLTTHLVVADSSRTEKTICLAITPSLKAYGIGGRARLFEVVQLVKGVNYRRAMATPQHRLTGKSPFVKELEEHPDWALDYIVAPPRMSYYIDYSTRIYKTYLKYVSEEDIHVYSIDEVFIDATNYLKSNHLTPREFAMKMIRDVFEHTGITATAGIGTNLYLSKIAMDIVAKHIPADKDGVRIAELDELSYRQQLWDHRPLTSFWRVGKGIARKLEMYGMDTMGKVARCSLRNEDFLYQLFGVNAELLIDHAWGWEPCTIADIKGYQPENHSIGNGQVLSSPYDYKKTKVVVQEMADNLALELVDKRLVTNQICLYIDYDAESLTRPEIREAYHGAITTSYYGKPVPKPVHGNCNLSAYTSSTHAIIEAATSLFDKIIDPNLLVRRLNITAGRVLNEGAQEREKQPIQLELFVDYEAQKKENARKEAAQKKERKVQEALLDIKKKFGKNAILKGLNFEEGATAKERNQQIGGHKA